MRKREARDGAGGKKREEEEGFFHPLSFFFLGRKKKREEEVCWVLSPPLPPLPTRLCVCVCVCEDFVYSVASAARLGVDKLGLALLLACLVGWVEEGRGRCSYTEEEEEETCGRCEMNEQRERERERDREEGWKHLGKFFFLGTFLSASFPVFAVQEKTKQLQWGSYAYPTTNGGMQNGSPVGACTRCMHVFARSAPSCMLSRCLVTELSASELSRKLIKSPLLVGDAWVFKTWLGNGWTLAKSPPPPSILSSFPAEREGGEGGGEDLGMTLEQLSPSLILWEP